MLIPFEEETGRNKQNMKIFIADELGAWVTLEQIVETLCFFHPISGIRLVACKD